ncbi:restriction endonuclease subunit R [Nostoc sp. 'Peltigera membranacea cyanobiont' 210A]|uniref:type I restriction enzyme HsdR N-terminal domain-containing protein n=1 Tax=Nostoc sp. 'Peltigera membranacea cyanobiont' 210A TaxID=2014529 RepID=UPI000B95B852|nr:type I restriction enzyme HsdR N-terminal domain-containing protein [Nostoc sp. 'Peltigera membranacea cyanobiont' 210A]OYD93005.1 restriction endonuclease subunit R [Nostoc sp. 'Peltigera membranacea cyanobiont' 210A]
MVQILQGKDITLAQLIDEFGLQLADDEDFFSEWRHDLPKLSDLEKQSLNEVKTEYLHLSKYPILEPVVKMVVLSPLLRLAGFYQPPFYIASEQEVKISSEDEGTIIRGRIDILVFHPPFWVLVIEAKRADYSLVPAISQALAYMLADATSAKPVFGFITNGNEFRFIKLLKTETPQYSLSDLFALDSRDDIYIVLKVLKHLAHLIRNS